MYPEFVPIYAMLALAVVMLIVLIVLAIVILKKLNSRPSAPVSRGAHAPAGATAQGGSVVFCRNCAKQFDASMRFCPHCGANR